MGIQMFSAIRKHVTYVNVAMTVALVFAMSGGAYAAGKYLITSTKQISPKVLKSLVGKTGPAGANGAPGAAGALGPAGPQGPAGAKGETGAAGTAGVEGKEGLEGKEGKEGPEGKAGKEGKEGTFGGQQLPAGKTLTGEWAASGYGEAGEGVLGEGFAVTGVTYALPVELALKETPEAQHYIKEKEWQENKDPAGCTGKAFNPGAEPGNLCVFAEEEVNVSSTLSPLQPAPNEGNLQDGFLIRAVTEAKGTIFLNGTWAATSK
jgi:hypothetical protein